MAAMGGNYASVALGKLLTRKELIRNLTALLVVVVSFAGDVIAQSQAINGTIRGRATDTTGAAIVGANVTVRNLETAFMRSVQTNDEGYYVIPNLPLGTYETEVKKSGFATLRAHNVVLQAGTDAVIDAPLQAAGVETTVEVTGGAPMIQASTIDIGRTITQTETQNLPLTSRNPYNFILFQPGVSGHPNQELGIPRTLNTNGLLDRINYQMDGMVDTQTDRHGLRLFPISDSYVREVQTVSNSFAPEFGQTAGNIFNVVTNSGTNQIHGMFHYIHRWIDATARPLLLSPTAPKPELKLNDYVANAGGPLIKEKLFWFSSYEHLERGQPQPTTITAANAAAIGLDPSLLVAGPGLLHGQFFDVRGDWIINNKHSAFLRYNYFKNDFPFNTNVGGLNALDATSDFADRAHVIGMQLVSTFIPNLLNEFRFSWPYRKNQHFAGPKTGPGPAVTISGIANFNGTTGAGDRFAEKIPSLNENLTIIRGRHSFKVGAAWQENVDLQAPTVFTKYTFANIAAYLAAKSGTNPRSYTTVQQMAGVGIGYHSVFWSWYGQDSWQVTPRLMLVGGVRYDKFVPPDASPTAPFINSRKYSSPSANFAPRLGFAYRVTSKTVLRGSGGIFYDAPATNTWFNPLQQNGVFPNFSLSGTAPNAPAFPALTVPPSSTIADLVTVAPNFRNAYTINTSLNIQHELTKNDSVTVGYIHTAGRNLEFQRNINPPAVIRFLADGRPVFGTNNATRPFQGFGNITQEESGARSNYDAAVINYTHRLSAGIEMSASYTWSHTISDAPEANTFEQNFSILDPTNRLRDRGNSFVNRPHSLTISSILQPRIQADNAVWRHIVNDNMFAVLVNLASGDQQNILANVNLNGDATNGTNQNQRPAFVSRNSVRGPSIYQVDARYTRTIGTFWERVKPQVFLEANNLFNHPNITTINTTATVNAATGLITTAPTLAAVSTVLEGRIVQFGASVHF
jgi:hypothetical protein